MKKLIAIVCAILMVLGLVLYAENIMQEDNHRIQDTVTWPENLGTKTIRYDVLADLLEKELGDSAVIIVLDATYTLIDENKLREALRADKTSESTYIPNSFDCDDFAFVLWRNLTGRYGLIALGVIIISFGDKSHVANFFIDEDLEFHYLEPQSDLIDPIYIGTPLVVII